MTVVDYLLFDVFTNRMFAGNPLAVVAGGPPLDAPTMQAIARELHLSETVFLQRASAASAAASLRIFSPEREMQFAGHPTIGSAIALTDRLQWPGAEANTFALELPIGVVPVSIERGESTVAWLTTPPVTFGREIAREDAAEMVCLGLADVRGDLASQLIGAGNPFLFVPLASKGAVDRASLDVAAVRAHVGWDDLNGIYVFAQTDDGAYARLFAPMSGIAEDPATGSATGPLYAYLAKRGALVRRDRFLNEQGVAMGRPSQLYVRMHWDGDTAERIEVGGSAVFVGEGRLYVNA